MLPKNVNTFKVLDSEPLTQLQALAPPSKQAILWRDINQVRHHVGELRATVVITKQEVNNMKTHSKPSLISWISTEGLNLKQVVAHK